MDNLDEKDMKAQPLVSSPYTSSQSSNTQSFNLKSFLSKKILMILVFAAATFVLLGTYLLLTLQQDNPSQSATNQLKTTTDPTANWQTYRNEEFGFEVKYPENARFIIPTWNSISDKPSVVIVKFNFKTGCIDEFMSLGVKEEDAIIECRGDDVDVAILEGKQETLREIVNEEASVLSKTHCNIQIRKIGATNALEISNKSESGGCLVGDSSFYYLEMGNKIFKIGISDNTDNITNQILSTFRFVEDG